MNIPERSLSFCKSLICIVIVFATASLVSAQNDQVDAAKQVTTKYLAATDQNDAQAAFRLIGEQWTRTQPKAEILGALAVWFNAKGGASTSCELVIQRTLTEEQAHAMAPTSTGKGNVYYFRYRSAYPGGKFFEDFYVGQDSDGVLRIQGHHPLPA